uniref:p11 n=1 Tax=Carnation ringspot virus TaxID=12268 RepID=A0A8K1IMI2_CRSV|nr:p11 [Carnation ringspot virus]
MLSSYLRRREPTRHKSVIRILGNRQSATLLGGGRRVGFSLGVVPKDNLPTWWKHQACCGVIKSRTLVLAVVKFVSVLFFCLYTGSVCVTRTDGSRKPAVK